MNILAFDTSLACCSAAILKEGQVLAHLFEQRQRGQAERLVPMIEEVCVQAELSLQEIDLIAVGRGPGTFTGIRIGLSAARGMALALNIPLMGLTSLETVAHGVAHNKGCEPGEAFMVAHDARRGEVYTQSFIREEAGILPLTEPLAVPLDRVEDFILPQVSKIIGTGAGLIQDRLQEPSGLIFSQDNALPDAAILANIAQKRHVEGQQGYEPQSVTPLYLRAPDAIAPKPVILPFQKP